MDLTSPRRSSRNHASTLALDVEMSVCSSLEKDDEKTGGIGEKPVEKKHTRSSSVTSSTASIRRSTRRGEEEKRDNGGKRKSGRPPTSRDGKRRRKRSETEDEESSEEEEDEDMAEEPPKVDFSVNRLISPGNVQKEEKPKRLDQPDDDALPFPTSVLFAHDALGKVDAAAQYPANCTQFNIGGIKFLPLSCLMDDDGFTVSINDSVTYKQSNGKKHAMTLAEALRNSGLSVKRRILGKELLQVLKVAGLVVHWAFVGTLSPGLLEELQAQRDKARKAHEGMLAKYAQLQGGASGGMASEEVVKKTVAELIQERKRRQNGDKTTLLNELSFRGASPSVAAAPLSTYTPPSPSTPSSSSIFPIGEYRSRSTGLEALAKAAVLRRGENMTVHELMLQQMAVSQGIRRESSFYDQLQTGPAPLKISDPDHLTKFIGLMNGEIDETSQSSQQQSHVNSFSDIDHVNHLSITEKILLISDFDGGVNEQQLSIKYRVPVDRIPAILRLRVPLIREQTRMFMDRRISRIRALPVRRTNFVGLNIMMWRFFKDCRDRGIALTGRQLKEHAMTIANQLGLQNFKGSEGWLDAFKRRHKIDLRTMSGEAVNYESDQDGNIVCTSMDGADDDDGSFDERDSASPVGDNITDQLLASVTAIVNNEQPVLLPPLSLLDGERKVDGEQSPSNGFQPNYDDPRMASDYRLDEASLIANIVRSTSIHVPNPEVAHALDVLRTYIVTHDPPAIGFFVDLQSRLASTIGVTQMIEGRGFEGLKGESEEGEGASGCGLLNGVGGMQDEAKTPPMVDGVPKEEDAEESEEKKAGAEAEEKENEEKAPEKSGEAAAAAAAPDGTVNSSHNSTTSDDSNDD